MKITKEQLRILVRESLGELAGPIPNEITVDLDEVVQDALRLPDGMLMTEFWDKLDADKVWVDERTGHLMVDRGFGTSAQPYDFKYESDGNVVRFMFRPVRQARSQEEPYFESKKRKMRKRNKR